MNVRYIRKALGLFVIDIVIIIGIFVLQFRTDSSIIEKIGNLQLTLTKADEINSSENADNLPNDAPALKNHLQANYNGLSFSIDDNNSAMALMRKEKEPKSVQLIDWEKQENQVILKFSDNIILNLILSNDTTEATLSVSAKLPSNVNQFYLPYTFSRNMNIQKDEGNHVILDAKKLSWNFKTEQVKDGYIVFDSDAVAYYSVYDDTKKFTFDTITELASAEESAYQNTYNSFKNNLIAAFKTVLAENNFTEQAAVSYVAAMAENGNFQQAVDDIPQSYKKSTTRTYLSAPYFNSLSAMDKILDQKINSDNLVIKKAADSGSLDIFTTHNIAEHLCIYPDSATVEKILTNAAEANFDNLSISHVTGIIQSFVGLSSTNTDYAKILSPIMPACLDKIAAACSYNNDILTISENDTFLSVVQAVETGIAVLRYGEITGNQTYTRAGRVLVNSYLQEGSASFDIRTLSNLYPLLAYKNWYYPHFEFIHPKGKDAMIWAWTCAKDITYEKDSEGDLNLNIDFPEGYTHYVIFKGIPSFSTIYIYNMAFRTDPRFEAYNSSGYVYKADTDTLLLKSRHKSKIENVRMSYSSKETEKKPSVPVPTANKTNITATGAVPTATTPAVPATTGSTETTQESQSQNTAAPAETAPVTAVVQPAAKTYNVILNEMTSIRTIIPLIKDLRGGDGSIGAQALQNLPVVILTDVSEEKANEAIAKISAVGGVAVKE